ncbi:MAG TPA: HEPN domain-containing protein [Isosphaeraceae bacterium]|jgi:hypothetical protein
MKLTAEDYLSAATERLEEARSVYDDSGANGRYVLAIYLAGVAVECVLRAFIIKKGRPMDTGHDLVALFVQSGLGEPLDPKAPASRRDRIEARRGELSGSIAGIKYRWSNNLRYTSRKRYVRHLRDAGQLGKHRGDELKENARQVIEAAVTVVTHGVKVWQKSSTR